MAMWTLHLHLLGLDHPVWFLKLLILASLGVLVGRTWCTMEVVMMPAVPRDYTLSLCSSIPPREAILREDALVTGCNTRVLWFGGDKLVWASMGNEEYSH